MASSIKSGEMDLYQLQQRISYSFKNTDLLKKAFTHRSHGEVNNERLEFLGDSLLDAVISEKIYKMFPNANEGRLSRMRAWLVRKETLAKIAKELNLSPLIQLGIGELKSGGHTRESVLADAFEAMTAAIYLDCQNWEIFRDCIINIFSPYLDKLENIIQFKDPKSLLQEWLQARHRPLPEYQHSQKTNADNSIEFTVSCHVTLLSEPVHATDSKKRKAEQQAATKALEQLQNLETEIAQ